MGWFSLINDLLDEDSDGAFEKKLDGAIGKLEKTLNTTLEKAEAGVRQVSDTVDKLDGNATQLGKRLDIVSDTANRTIDGIKKQL
jgi:methyl-accepting chemotaxis protein